MFNVGPLELLAILAFALIVLGPQRLPEAVRTVGRVVGELRRISGGFQEELRNALDDSDAERDIDRLRASGDEADLEATASTSTASTPTEDPDDDPLDDKDPTLDDDPAFPLVPADAVDAAEVTSEAGAGGLVPDTESSGDAEGATPDPRGNEEPLGDDSSDDERAAS